MTTEWSYSFVDLSKSNPEYFLSANQIRAKETWLVPYSPISIKSDHLTDWIQFSTSDHIRIPLHKYKTISEEPANVLALAIEIGMRYLLDFQTSLDVSIDKIKHIHMSVGVPLQLVTDEDNNQVYEY
jgi:hypothetical protein